MSATGELPHQREQLIQQLSKIGIPPPFSVGCGMGITGTPIHGPPVQAEAAAEPASAVISCALARTVHDSPRVAMAASVMRAPRK